MLQKEGDGLEGGLDLSWGGGGVANRDVGGSPLF